MLAERRAENFVSFTCAQGAGRGGENFLDRIGVGEDRPWMLLEVKAENITLLAVQVNQEIWGPTRKVPSLEWPGLLGLGRARSGHEERMTADAHPRGSDHPAGRALAISCLERVVQLRSARAARTSSS